MVVSNNTLHCFGDCRNARRNVGISKKHPHNLGIFETPHSSWTMVFVAGVRQQRNLPVGIILGGLLLLVPLFSYPVTNPTSASHRPFFVGEHPAPLQYMWEGAAAEPEWRGTEWTFVEESTDGLPSYYVRNDIGTGNTKR